MNWDYEDDECSAPDRRWDQEEEFENDKDFI